MVPTGDGNHAVAADIAPETQITVINQQESEPPWKRLWDQARNMVAAGELAEAVELYRQILEEKPNIEEVRWEQAKVLLELKRYETAAAVIEMLLEIDPGRVDYLLSGAGAAMEIGREVQAGRLYGRAIEAEPDGESVIAAMTGLVRALKAQNRRQPALAVMEQLYQRGYRTVEMQLDLARYNVAEKRWRKAAHYYRELIQKYRVEAEVLLEAADLLERTGDLEAAVKLRESYLEREPESIPIRRWLAVHYQTEKLPKRAMPHLLFLLDKGVDREQNLLRAGRIYLYSFGRADRALVLLERYQQEFPDGIDVSKEIASIQLILANDFLSIVENDGVWMLWRDLATLTPDRVGIYRAMATLLEELGKRKELREVLEIIAQHRPAELDVRLKLARMYVQEKQFDQCVEVLRSVPAQKSRDLNYLRLLYRCQKRGKQDWSLLETAQSYLHRVPNDLAIRLEAMKLAARLGSVTALRELADAHQATPEVALAFLDGLLENRLLKEAERFMDRLLETGPADSEKAALLVRKARLAKIEGDLLQAEQALRRRVLLQSGAPTPFLDLAQLALEQKNVPAARIWLDQADRLLSGNLGESAVTEMRSRRLLIEMQLLGISEGYGAMEQRARTYLRTREQATTLVAADQEILKLLVQRLGRQERWQEAEAMLREFEDVLPFDHELHALRVVAQATRSTVPWSKVLVKRSPVETLEIGRQLLTLEKYQDTLEVLQLYCKSEKITARPLLMLAKAKLSSKDYPGALAVYRQLESLYPKERYFSYQSRNIDYHKGDYQAFVDGVGEAVTEIQDIVGAAKTIADPGFRRQLARALWNLGRWDEALQVYQDLVLVLRGKVEDLELMLRQEYPQLLPKQARFWERIGAGSEQELFEQILERGYFIDHQDNPAVSLATRSFAAFEWHQLISKEHSARKSLMAREFYQAEQDYRELFADRESEDEAVYPDLATIYSRLERTAQEAEILEKIKQRQESFPEMQEAVARSVRQRQPKLYFDGSYLDEEGRYGYRDIRRWSSGLGLILQPTIYQEFGFHTSWSDYEAFSREDIDSLAINGQYSLFINENLTTSVQLGFVDLEPFGQTYLAYDAELSGRLEEAVGFKVGASQKLVEDTLDALEQGIYQRRYGAGLTLDYLPHLFMGFSFDITRYRDENSGKLFNLWASYRLFGEDSRFEFSYDYDRRDNQRENSRDGRAVDDPAAPIAYWSPGDYWRHLVTLEYRQELWPSGRLYSGTSHLTGKYGIGYESGDRLVQLLEVHILLEINPMFLLKGTFTSDWTEGYDRNQAYLSLSYRW